MAEGGSKAVGVVDLADEDAAANRDYVLRRSVKVFANTILDLTTPEPMTKSQIVDLLEGKQELIYLGPDEQIIPEDLDWIIERAIQGKQMYQPHSCRASRSLASITRCTASHRKESAYF